MVVMADKSVPTSDHIRDIISFVEASPTSYHAVAELTRRLEQAGFQRLEETESWPSVEGRRYVVRDGAVIAWITPEKVTPQLGARIVGSHTDSPSFKLKPNATVTNQADFAHQPACAASGSHRKRRPQAGPPASPHADSVGREARP